mmetsp:Transcript_339/g.745  ORF Transcript_339/g.745 Transcript_339/m.745 type:complete len:491 (-) Transcript_339:120-1592(-)
MAPNRKSFASVLRSLSTEDLSGFVTQSKYAPLTSFASAPVLKQLDQVQEQVRIELKIDPTIELADVQHEEEYGNYWDEGDEKVEESTNYWDEAPQEEEGVSYWDWPQLSVKDDALVNDDVAEANAQDAAWAEEVARREAIVAQVMAEKAAQQVVSLGNIEAQLIKEAERRSTENEDEIVRAGGDVPEEGYWDWDAENDVPPEDVLSADYIASMLMKGLQNTQDGFDDNCVQMSGPQHYWDWPTLSSEETKQKVINSILEDEHARKLLSVSHVEANLLKGAARGSGDVVRNVDTSAEDYWAWTEQPSAKQLVKAPHMDDPTHPNHSYWDWTPAVTPEEEKENIIARILKDENARKAVSVSCLEENLKADSWKRAKVEMDGWYLKEATEEVSKTIDADYWTWAEEKSEIVRAPHVDDPSHPSNSYWDWDSSESPVDESQINQQIIAKILQDEAARQAVSVHHLEEQLKHDACAQKEEMVVNSAPGDASYWDM